MAVIEIQYAIDVLEGIAATVEQGVYNIISHTPVNPLVLDQKAIALLEQQAGVSLERVVTDAGETIGYVAKGAAQAGNGAATEVSTYVNVLTKETVVDAEMAAGTYIDMATGETAALTVGETVTEVSAAGTFSGLAGIGVAAAGVAIGVALGIAAGDALYDVAPDFWMKVSDDLFNAGELISGKVKTLFDTDGKTSFSKNTIEIYKNAFLNAGYFNAARVFPDISEDVRMLRAGEPRFIDHEEYNDTVKNFRKLVVKSNNEPVVATKARIDTGDRVFTIDATSPLTGYYNSSQVHVESTLNYNNIGNWTQEEIRGTSALLDKDENVLLGSGGIVARKYVVDGVVQYHDGWAVTYSKTDDPDMYDFYASFLQPQDPSITYEDLYDFSNYAWFNNSENPNAGHTQDDAVLPSAAPFDQTYPDWNPNHNIQGDDYYPTSMPSNNGNQEHSQTGDNDDDELDALADILFNPDPIPEPQPQPDPDPQPEPEPDTDTNTPTPVPDPMDPNPEPDPSDPSPTLPIISGIHATKMCTIYNPTDGEVDDLGAFLWVDNVIEQIRLIFQDPMDGIISLHKIYAQPVTGTRKDIILGYIDSGVDALEVTNQFTTVNCGSVTVGEKYGNATDYPPYTQAHIYLPFIGIEEIDVAEIMGGTVRVQYRVDAYTGTCVAQIFVTRSADMSTEQMLYTFSGNASQTIPLTSANFTGLVSSLVSIAGGAATAGAGGALLAAGRGLTSHMASVSHSGSISANAGIMGPRVPYIILTRPQGYDANSYNSLYGFPTNITRYLSNCSGYVRVKDVLYRGDGTEEEKREIVSLLKNGIIV